MALLKLNVVEESRGTVSYSSTTVGRWVSSYLTLLTYLALMENP